MLISRTKAHSHRRMQMMRSRAPLSNRKGCSLDYYAHIRVLDVTFSRDAISAATDGEISQRRQDGIRPEREVIISLVSRTRRLEVTTMARKGRPPPLRFRRTSPLERWFISPCRSLATVQLCHVPVDAPMPAPGQSSTPVTNMHGEFFAPILEAGRGATF